MFWQSQLRPFQPEVRGHAGRDGGVVHGVMERRRFRRHHPEQLRFLLGEADGSETGPGELVVRLLGRSGLAGLLRLGGARGVDVVGLGGPLEQRGPPGGGGG